jgi:hypothetical protein
MVTDAIYLKLLWSSDSLIKWRKGSGYTRLCNIHHHQNYTSLSPFSHTQILRWLEYELTVASQTFLPLSVIRKGVLVETLVQYVEMTLKLLTRTQTCYSSLFAHTPARYFLHPKLVYVVFSRRS